MKTMYVCEKCGKQFENYNDCCACENSHLLPMNTVTDYDDLNVTHYAPGKPLPDSLVVAFRKVGPDGWYVERENHDDGTGMYEMEYAEYKLVKKSDDTMEQFSRSIDDAVHIHERKAHEEHLAWLAKYNAEKAQREAEKTAESESDAE